MYSLKTGLAAREDAAELRYFYSHLRKWC